MFKTKQYTIFLKYMYTYTTLRPEWKGTFNFRIIVILVEGKYKNGVWEGLSVALNLWIFILQKEAEVEYDNIS